MTSSNEDYGASLSFFLSFLPSLSLSFFRPSFLPSLVWHHYLLTVSVEGCTWSHPWTHTQSVGLRWTRDRLDVETSTWRHSKETFMLPPGFEPAMPALQLPQTYALQRCHRDRLYYLWVSKLFIVVTEVIGYLKHISTNYITHTILIYCARIILRLIFKELGERLQ